MKIGSISKTKEIISDHDFHIKKKYGQNFLIDENILRKIVSYGDITEDTGVIEIGPGLGALTQIIAEKARSVLCYEIDETLIPILKQTLDTKNITVLNQDILTADVSSDINKYLSSCKRIILMANLPYYITTPILLGLLEKDTSISSYIVMMQKEVADRICSSSNVKEYNSLSIAIQYRAYAKKMMVVPKTVFIPAPNVDSTVVKLERYERERKPSNERFFFELIRASFAQRRKTLVNNLIFKYGHSKDFFEKTLESLNINQNVRSEALDIEAFISLSDALDKIL